VSICAIRGKNKKTIMSEIPKKLKWFTPFDILLSYGVNVWRVSVNEMTGCVEIQRTPLIKKSTMILAVALGVALFTVFAAIVFDRPPIGDDQRTMALIGMFVVSPAIIVGIPALDAFVTLHNSKHWKGHLRFRCDPQSGELFFPRENISYRLKDCSKIVLGCVRGVDKRGWTRVSKKFGGVYYKVGSRQSNGILSRRTAENKPTTQIFMLILDKNDEWQRHDITYDLGSWRNSESGSKQFLKIVDRLQPFLSFDQFVKDYSQDECYEQQNKG
jgi:hypothetical protein